MTWTKEQAEAITAREPHICVDAGAGSGKTRVLIERIVDVLARGEAELDHIVAITFTDAAAAEMKDRLRKAFREKAPVDEPRAMSLWRDRERRVDTARVSTIHGFCSALLRENALLAGLDPDFVVLAEAETVMLRRETVQDAVHALFEEGDAAAMRLAVELGAGGLVRELVTMLQKRPVADKLPEVYGAGDPEALCAHWAQSAEPLPVTDTERGAAALTCALYAVYRRVADAFDNAKAERSSMDFDDLIRRAVEMLEKYPEILARTAEAIRFILIDEFQDTDSQQLRLVRRLCGHSGGPRLFIVGDAKQSIYDFRGAEVEVFQEEQGHTQRRVQLRRNFRTVPEVLGFVNDFFTRTGLLSAVEDVYTPLEVHRPGAGEPRVEFLVPSPGDGEQKLSKKDGRVLEAEMIAARIAELCGGPEPCAKYGEVALLFRTTTNMYLYEQGLRRQGIPYHVVSGQGYYKRQEIIDLRNLLTVLIDPWDEAAVAGFLRSPLAGLSDEDLLRTCGRAGVAAVFLGVSAPETGPGLRWEAARALIDDLRAHSEMPLPAFLRYVLERTGYEALLLSQYLGIQKAGNVRKLVDLAEDFSRAQPPKLSAFVRYLDDVAQEGVREGEATLEPLDAGAVTLMTIHKAKGLEFPVVIIPDLGRETRGSQNGPVVLHRDLGMALKVTDKTGEAQEPALYTLIKARLKEKADAEEARVLYVAMTRARDRLLLAGAPERSKRKTWLGEFDKQYGVVQATDGAEVGGDGWRAVVRHHWKVAEPAARPEETVDAEVVAERYRREGLPLEVGTLARRTFSVSELLDWMTKISEEEGEYEADPEFSERRSKAQARGTAVHLLFELWDFHGEPPVELTLQTCPGLTDADTLALRLEQVARQVLASTPADRLEALRTARRETPFLLRVGDALVSGSIDALLEDGTVVDYKTGTPRPDRDERYALQIQLYAAAVEQLTGVKPPAGLVYYTDTGHWRVVNVNPDALQTALARAGRAIQEHQTAPMGR